MTKTLVLGKKEIKIEKCVYKEDRFHLVDIDEKLIGSYILEDATYNGVLNLNALYKNFIDYNFEYNFDVQDHRLIETNLPNGSLYITISALNDKNELLQSYYYEIKPI